MKIFTNLPGKLRFLFGLLRGLTVVLAAFWLLLLTSGAWLESRFASKPNLRVTFGEVLLPAAATSGRGTGATITSAGLPESGPLALVSDTAKPGSVRLESVHGQLSVDMFCGDARLVAATLWSMVPAILTGTGFAWMLFGALRLVCANIERGEIFTEKNLRLVRNIGVLIIAYSFVNGATTIWASSIMDGYLNAHVTLTSLGAMILFPNAAGLFHFTPSPMVIPYTGGLVTGCLVLVVSEAFRQGLALKTENDLTV